eukprot:gene19988-27351_t
MESAMSCVLRVPGEHLDIDVLLRGLNLIPIVAWRKRDEGFSKGQFHAESGANFDVLAGQRLPEILRKLAASRRTGYQGLINKALRDAMREAAPSCNGP